MIEKKDMIDFFNERMLSKIRQHLYITKRIGIKQFLELDKKIWEDVKNTTKEITKKRINKNIKSRK